MHASLPALLAATDEYTPMSFRQVVLVFVAIPAAMYLTIWLLLSFPRWRRGDSYRPGDAWTADGQWFGGPPSAAGSAPAALEATSADGAPDDAEAVAPQGGGTSARW